MANLDRFSGSCITLDDLFDRIPVPNKTENMNISGFKSTPMQI